MCDMPNLTFACSVGSEHSRRIKWPLFLSQLNEQTCTHIKLNVWNGQSPTRGAVLFTALHMMISLSGQSPNKEYISYKKRAYGSNLWSPYQRLFFGANHCFHIIHSNAVPEFSAPLQSLVYNSTLFITIFQQSFCHSSNTIAAGGPLFSVLLSWKLRLILTQHFLHVLHKKSERSGRSCEPLWKMLKMPSRLRWDAGLNRCKDRIVFITSQAKREKRTGIRKHWGLTLNFLNNNKLLTGEKKEL